jgi:uncharacterized protein YegJ (DUF2314 family)
MKYPYIFAPLFFILILSCKSGKTEKLERDGEPDLVLLTNEDKEMNEAIQEAKRSFPAFLSALEKMDTTDSHSFQIKMRFDHPDGGEHIWIDGITMINHNLVGVIANNPVSINEIKIGDTITIDKNRISDWMYFKGKAVHGGYTIKLLRKRMSPDERSQFDLESDNAFQ